MTNTHADNLRQLASIETSALWSQRKKLNEAAGELERLQQHVHDLQSGMYINCVYCGHRYGPEDEVPATMADALKEHIEQCPKHPMSALKIEIERLHKIVGSVVDIADELNGKEWPVYEIQKKAASLQETIDNLPKTANGVILEGAMRIYVTKKAMTERSFSWEPYDSRTHDDRDNPLLLCDISCGNLVWCPPPIDGGRYITVATTNGILKVALSYCFSTREAAEAAASYNEPDIMDKAAADAAKDTPND